MTTTGSATTAATKAREGERRGYGDSGDDGGGDDGGDDPAASWATPARPGDDGSDADDATARTARTRVVVATTAATAGRTAKTGLGAGARGPDRRRPLRQRRRLPRRGPRDFADDRGDWSEATTPRPQDLFGGDPRFGESAIDRWTDRGYVPARRARVLRLRQADRAGQSKPRVHAPRGASCPRLRHDRGALALRAALPYVDFSQVDVTVFPRRAAAAMNRSSPSRCRPELAAVDPRDTVDLRPYCSPVGDQGPTSRCAAFARGPTRSSSCSGCSAPHPRCRAASSCCSSSGARATTATAWAYEGGEGTSGSWEPGAARRARHARAAMW